MYIYLFISLTTSGRIHLNTQGKIAEADIEYCVLTFNVHPSTSITTHSLSLTLSSFTYLYLSRLVGEVPSGPAESRGEVFPHLLPALAGAPQEFGSAALQDLCLFMVLLSSSLTLLRYTAAEPPGEELHISITWSGLCGGSR